MRFEFKNIFIISPEPWGLNFISKHHYAIKLAERENNVFFFNPPGNEFKKTVISKMLTVIDYKPIMRGINKLPGMIRDRLAANDIKRIKNKLHIPSPDIIWSFDAFRFSNLNIFGRGALKIYYAADLRNTPLEQLLLDTADLVLAPSNQILRHFQTSTPKFFVNHGLSDHFLIEYNYKLSNKGQKLKAGYVGNIVSRFIDYELMLKTIINNPSVDFYFIGPYDISNLTIKVDDDIKAAISKLKQQQNVILLGSKPFKELILHYEYLDFFGYAMIRLNITTKHLILIKLSNTFLPVNPLFLR